MRRRIRIAASGLYVCLTASVALAQGGTPVALRVAVAPPTARADSAAIPAAVSQAWRPASGARAPWWAPVLSGVVPGAGQFAMGQQRSVGYLVAEGYLILQQVRARRDANRDRDAYRALAFEVARQPFGGERPRGSWDYYESMEKYLESGAFDRIPGGSIDPETDESTYNGARWLLARETYWLNPAVAPAVGSAEYQRALAFYQSRAVPAAFQWSWRDAQLQRDVYAQTIASANRSVQRAVNYVGLIGANHLVSLIDAYVSVRVRRFGGAGVVGMSMESIHTVVEPVGDPRDGRRQLRTAIRLVPERR
ncbi:hypothetical protein [Gemmatimonas groenlandica]|uniref:DUF5683 domain-containing protein n=1 Tax=Gemmatimonas groenlandica TaxID=2732249 RepID=A0A6M4IJ55_9BACT|nr:hypothetical protein [Gemmatimonas groenlandica]QJR35124.1 hypothetical protein HKW67_06175 [Gemmatimonas groenlandica]